jgi:hypothetical protein
LNSTVALVLAFGGTACARQDDAAWQEDLNAFLEVLHAEHDNPFFHTPRAEFELAIADYRAALPGLSRAERITGFARLVAMVGDGHTWMPMYRLPFDGLPPGPRFSSLPIRFELFDDGLYVVGAGAAYSRPFYRSGNGRSAQSLRRDEYLRRSEFGPADHLCERVLPDVDTG